MSNANLGRKDSHEMPIIGSNFTFKLFIGKNCYTSTNNVQQIYFMDTRLRRIVTVLLPLLFVLPSLYGQIIYYNYLGEIFSLNISDCSVSFVTNGQAFNDMAVGTGNTYYGVVGNSVYSINGTNGSSTLITTVSNPLGLTGMELSPTGTLYVLRISLFAVNPATGAVTNLGTLPNGWVCIGDIVLLDGEYYASVLAPNGQNLLINLNVTNPALSTVVTTMPGNNFVAGAGVTSPNCPKMYWFNNVGGFSTVWEYDVNTQSWTQVCPGFSFPTGGAGTPNGYSFPYECPCLTDAGSTETTPLAFCVGNPAVVPFNNDATLDSDDLLQYILLSDPANLTGSILATGNTPSIGYNTAYTLGQTYYLAVIAGNNVNGSVDLLDPCLDVSDLVPIIWRPNPSVVFSAPPGPFCAGDCVSLSVNFTGDPPFSLDATVHFSGTPLDNIAQIFNNNTGTVSICIPPALPTGPLTVQATSLIDAFCVCN
jgi:hypothetical protein